MVNNPYCKVMVFSSHQYKPTQCRRLARKEGFCSQHHPKSVAKRVAKRKRTRTTLEDQAIKRSRQLLTTEGFVVISQKDINKKIKEIYKYGKSSDYSNGQLNILENFL